MLRRHLSALIAFLLGSCASKATLEVPAIPAESWKCAGEKFSGEPRERRCFEIRHDTKASEQTKKDAEPGG